MPGPGLSPRPRHRQPLRSTAVVLAGRSSGCRENIARGGGHGLGSYLFEVFGHHIANSPTLVFYQAAEGRQKHAVAGLLLFRNNLGDGNKDLDSQEAHAVLVVLSQMLKQGYHLIDYNSSGHLLHETRHVCGGLAPDHRRLIVNKVSKLLAELFLDSGRHLLVGGGVQAAARHLGCEPVGFR